MLDVSIDLIKKLEQSTPEKPIPCQSPEYKRFKELYDLATKYYIENLHQPLTPHQETLRLITALLRISSGIPPQQPLTNSALLASVNHVETTQLDHQKLLKKAQKRLLSGNGAPPSSSDAANENTPRRIQKETPTLRAPVEMDASPSSSGAAHQDTTRRIQKEAPTPRAPVEMGASWSSSGAAHQDTTRCIQKQTPTRRTQAEIGAAALTSSRAALLTTNIRFSEEFPNRRLPPSSSCAAHAEYTRLVQQDKTILQNASPYSSGAARGDTSRRIQMQTPIPRTPVEMGAPAPSSSAANASTNLRILQEFPKGRPPPSNSYLAHAKYTRLVQKEKTIPQPSVKIPIKRLSGVQAASTSSCAVNDDSTLARLFQKATQIAESSDEESAPEELEIPIRTKCGRLVRKPDRLGQK